MPLRDLNLQCEYRSDQTNTVTDFYIPCLGEAIGYWRAVGYFTSQGLALAAKGIATFIQHGGYMRLVASPCLTEEDIFAIQQGYSDREAVVEQAIVRQLTGDFPDIVQYRLECLAWLIAQGRLEVKIACPLELSHAIYHEKIGIFMDSDENAVAFTGSQNETVGGLLTNFESIDVYWSWDDPHQRVQRKKDHFNRLWSNLTPKLKVLDFPLAAKQKLLQYQPTSPPTIDPESLNSPLSIMETHTSSSYQRPIIDIPSDITLRAYQREAIDAWFENDCRGFLEMATGSGKTITALAALARLFKEKDRLFALIACPFQHLVEQWNAEACRFGFKPILAYQSRRSWENRLNSHLIDYNWGIRKVVCAITTHDTFISEVMQRTLSRLKGDAILVADEAHHLGAVKSRQNLSDLFSHRLGLSATPSRWFDEEGTTALTEYFGETVYEFPLDRAIREGFLCPYYYYPHLVELTPDELDQYEALTEKIAKLFPYRDDEEKESILEHLLRQRADLLNKAENKLPILKQLVADESESLSHALFYCAPGQIDEVIPMLGNEVGLRVHRFTAEESTDERLSLLDQFASGRLQGLVAMRCLDEGVDVPSTQFAYILASSSNPREFIQRRGRILRKAPGKEHALIHDLIAVPPLRYRQQVRQTPIFSTERKIVERELKRFREFADTAINRFQATNEIWELAQTYNLMGF
ncbi:DEAD/DEAH box helicase family protein [Candidatus Poribacteria bacterium]|nr:DEAD/DEAH box helicase family protein [Candidatus Poribacteria bacterium]